MERETRPFEDPKGPKGTSPGAADPSHRSSIDNVLDDKAYGVLAEAAADAVIRIDHESIIEFVNSAATRVFGHAAQDMLGHSLTMLMPEELRERHRVGFGRYLATGERHLNWECIEIVGLHKDGHTFPLEISFGEYKSTTRRFFLGIARDITRRKATEKALKQAELRAQEILHASRQELGLRVEERTAELAAANAELVKESAERQKAQEERVALLGRLLTSQEDERRRIARDMHDHFGQQLTALRLQLEALRAACDDEVLCDKVAATQKIAEQLDSDVSFLVWELRPTALDDLGLEAALAHYIEKWSLQFEIPVEYRVGAYDGKRVSVEAQTSIYRIAQEALNNIYKYADAQHVSVQLEIHASELVMIVEDDGRGFDVNDKEAPRTGLGLIGMSERAALIGGKLTIESALGTGTTLFVRIPLEP